MGLVAAVALAWGVWTLVDDDPDATGASENPSDTATATESPKATPGATGKTPGAVVPTDEPTAIATDPAGERAALDPVKPGKVAKPSKSVAIRVVKVESVKGKVVLPSDTKGPAVRLTIKVANRSDDLLDTRFAVVNAYHGDELTPANVLSQPGGRAFPTSIAAGESATGVYLFSIRPKDRKAATVEVDLAPQLPVARFVGNFG